MAHGKETPRQKMIGMMYLVLMALLALNVSREVLEAFVLVDEGLTKTIENSSHKNDVYYQEFDKAAAENPVKAGPWKAKADEVKRRSNDLHDYIQELKYEIIRLSEGEDTEAIVGDHINGEEIDGKDNTDIPAQVMIGAALDGKANDLRMAIEDYRSYLISLTDEEAVDTRESIENNLDTSDPPPKEGEVLRWQDEHFLDLPLIAVITLMSKMQSDIRNAESDIIRYLYEQIEAGSFNFNLIEPVIIPKSNHVTTGNEYEASVFLAAFDTTQKPIVYIGEYDSTITDEGEIEYFMKGERGRDYDTVPVESGKGLYKIRASSTGWKKWGGIISLKRLDGTFTNKPFKSEYQVAPPSLVVAPTKMNVFYLGVDNPVEISVPGIPADRIIASSNNGRITPSGVGYIVRPTREGSCDISVSVREGSTTRSQGSRPFRVRKVPDPYVTLAGSQSGAALAKSQILGEMGPQATMPDWFEFDLKFDVVSFSLSATQGGFTRTEPSTSAIFTGSQREMLRAVNPGSKIYIEDVIAVGPDGSQRNIGTIVIKVR
ncbi:MAG: hypothetical protein AMS27_09955 [Bacteroides sp. SM23_62_1]|nr:MAG: hypothetical protein AMS27_09955 [Bacteroides sp. SM23_62_1]